MDPFYFALRKQCTTITLAAKKIISFRWKPFSSFAFLLCHQFHKKVNIAQWKAALDLISFSCVCVFIRSKIFITLSLLSFVSMPPSYDEQCSYLSSSLHLWKKGCRVVGTNSCASKGRSTSLPLRKSCFNISRISKQSIVFFFSLEFQVESFTMCPAKCAAIIVQANTMEYLRVTDVLASSNVRFVDRAITCAKQKRRANALSTKPIGISAVHVG